MQQGVIAQSTRNTVCALLVSPTGLDGFCKGLNSSWGIAFQGFVIAA
jgi:hypothetical protein